MIFQTLKFMIFENFNYKAYKNIELPEKARTTHATQLLAWYIKPSRSIKTVLEVGAGSGYISLYLGKMFKSLDVKGLELNKEFIKLFNEGIKMNNLSNVSIINSNLFDEDFLKREKEYDMIISNPPHYIDPGIWSKSDTRITERSLTRNQFEKFVSTFSKLLKNKGTFYLVLNTRDSIYWFSELLNNKMGIHRLRFIHGRPEKQAKLILVKGIKNSRSNVVVEPTIYLESGDNNVHNI